MSTSITLVDKDGDHHIIDKASIDTINVCILKGRLYVSFILNRDYHDGDALPDIKLRPVNYPSFTLKDLYEATMVFGRTLIDDEPDEVIQKAWDRVRDNIDPDATGKDNIIL